MRTRFINCTYCQTEGRVYYSNGGPDDIDGGVCPVCLGERVVEVEVAPIDIDDMEQAHDDRTRT